MALKGSNFEGSGTAVNLIGRGTVVTGDIRAESSIRIDGKVKGKIDCKNTVNVGESGEVEGDVQAVNAVISGKVKGKLIVKQKVNLESKSSFTGELKAAKLIVDEGALFNGTSDMGGETSAPALPAMPDTKTKQ